MKNGHAQSTHIHTEAYQHLSVNPRIAPGKGVNLTAAVWSAALHCMGLASTHFVKKSVAVRQYELPLLDLFKGPMRSTPIGNWLRGRRKKKKLCTVLCYQSVTLYLHITIIYFFYQSCARGPLA